MSVVIPFPRRPGPFVRTVSGRPTDAPISSKRWYLGYSESGDDDEFSIVSDRDTLSESLDDARYWRSEGVQIVMSWGIV